MVPTPMIKFILGSLDLVSAEVVVVMEEGPGWRRRCTTFWRHCMMRDLVVINFWATQESCGAYVLPVENLTESFRPS